MPSENAFDLLFDVCWEQFLGYNSLALAHEDVDDVVSTQNLEGTLLDHWNVAGWVDSNVLWLLVIALEWVDVVENVGLASLVADSAQTPGLAVENVSVNGQLLWHVNLPAS